MSSNFETISLSWPGLGDEPPDPAVQGMDALVARVIDYGNGPVDVVAQSMGAIVAMKLALEKPQLIRRIVLVCCSGGLDMSKFGATDWRPDYLHDYPRAAHWITAQTEPYEVAFEKITAPTLLLWGGCDSISPVAVGRHLAERIPNASLHVIADAGHDLALTHSPVAAELIRAHLEVVA